MRKKIFHDTLRCTAAVFSLAALTWASPITRMDLFDASDNHLLFITFDYNDKGDCIQRNVFSSDSTFMYSTTFTTSNGVKKEHSVDYLDNTIYNTNINAPSGGATAFTTVDQFGLSQFGAPLSWKKSTENTYDITQNGAKVCTQKYEYNADGDLTGITVMDKNGNKAWYAQIIHHNVAVRRGISEHGMNPMRFSVSRSAIKFYCTLSEAKFVSVELISPAGRRIESLVHGNLTKGKHSFSSSTRNLASGAYIVRVSIDGTFALTRKVIVQK